MYFKTLASVVPPACGISDVHTATDVDARGLSRDKCRSWHIIGSVMRKRTLILSLLRQEFLTMVRIRTGSDFSV